ncbi:NlpC/P60 family protein [Streptomyces sp. NPDC051976]|uniref:C40 family peptidase n=1 Tax=Streptomyces sp. NPDC051976 TaxID=3154947 RepID=UPI0034298C62
MLPQDAQHHVHHVPRDGVLRAVGAPARRWRRDHRSCGGPSAPAVPSPNYTGTDAHGAAPSHWCDCSSLIQEGYRAADLELPRTTYAQVVIGQPVSVDTPLPGDLVFASGADGTPSDGLLLEAPHSGAGVRLTPYSGTRNAVPAENRVVAVRRVVLQ